MQLIVLLLGILASHAMFPADGGVGGTGDDREPQGETGATGRRKAAVSFSTSSSSTGSDERKDAQLEELEREFSALEIQRIARGFLARRRVAQLRHAASSGDSGASGTGQGRDGQTGGS